MSNINVYAQPDVIPVQLVTDTSAYADNDVLSVPLEVPNFFRTKGGVTVLRSIVLHDLADQAQDIDVLFMSATGTLGTINAAVSATDAVAATILGTVRLVAADYDDYINGQVITKTGLYLPMLAADGATSVWVATVCRSGTPTYAAASLTLKLGVERY